MTESEHATDPDLAARPPREGRARSHAEPRIRSLRTPRRGPRRRPGAAPAAAILGLALALAPGCDRGAGEPKDTVTAGRATDPRDLVPKDAPVPEWARQRIAEFVEAMRPIDPSLTSNHHDRHYWRVKALVEELEKASPEIGWAALHTFTNFPERDFTIRRNLLRVGAHAAPEESKNLLEFLTFTYGPYIEDRTEACLLMAEVSPERYMELARPFVLRRGMLRQTLPNDEFLVKGWKIACERSGTSPVPVMSDVATNLMLEPYARVIALRTLAQHELTPESQSAMQTCLVESMGDGFIRVVAAQSIAASYPREDACSLLREVRAREADPHMVKFLEDLIAETCH